MDEFKAALQPPSNQELHDLIKQGTRFDTLESNTTNVEVKKAPMMQSRGLVESKIS